MTIAGLILAGGRGRRMGGTEKLFLPCRGGDFRGRLLEALAPLKTIYLSVDGEEPYRNTGLPLVVDRYPDTGPMGGICSALEQCPEDALFVTACDMPHLNRETVERLLRAASRSGILTLARTADGVQPLLGVYPASVLPHLQALLQEGCLRMRALLKQVVWTQVPVDRRAADNINTVAEYQALLRMEGQPGPPEEETMVSLEEAVSALRAAVEPMEEAERVPLQRAVGRILAEAAIAAGDQPPFARSPLDGYAVRGADVAGADRTAPAVLQVRGCVWAGQVYAGTVGPGEAVRIMTGAPIPSGADTVIRQEDTDRGQETVRIFRSSAPWENYCPAGEDYRAGDTLLPRGAVLNGAAIALLASLGQGEVPVFRRPRVAVLSTGDELCPPGVPLPPGKIYDANRFYLAARLEELGAEPVLAEQVGDETEAIVRRLRTCRDLDLVLTTGGVSVGERDRLPEVLEQLGAEILFRRVAIKPGAPAIGGKLGRTVLLCLSGNPYAAAATFELLARPVLEKLSGNPALGLRRVRAVLESDFPKRSGVRRFLRGTFSGGRVRITAGSQASGAMAALRGCDCLVEIPPACAGARSGMEVEVYLL